MVLVNVGPPRFEATRARGATAAAAALICLTGCAAGEEQAAMPSAPPGTASGEYPRTVDGATGPVTVEQAPTRVATVNLNYIGPFLGPFLGPEGVELVGYGTARDIAEYNPWLEDMATDVPGFDNAGGANLEALAGYRPDLILANGDDGYWDSAAEVAPLLNVDDSDWRQATRLLGETFDQEATAERTIAETEQLIAGAERAEPVEIAVMWADSTDPNVTFGYEGAAIADILAELGLETGPGRDPDSGGYEQVSVELAAERLDVDYVVVLDFATDDESAAWKDTLLDNPVLQNIPVISDGRFVTLTPQETQAGNPASPMTIPLLIEATTSIEAAG